MDDYDELLHEAKVVPATTEHSILGARITDVLASGRALLISDRHALAYRHLNLVRWVASLGRVSAPTLRSPHHPSLPIQASKPRSLPAPLRQVRAKSVPHPTPPRSPHPARRPPLGVASSTRQPPLLRIPLISSYQRVPSPYSCPTGASPTPRSGAHAVLVDSRDEFVRQVRYYSQPEHEGERRRIVQAAARLMEAAPLSRLADAAVWRMREALELWRRQQRHGSPKMGT